ncbi:hypothetical protein PTTG_07160 [Puccinia triticina 1-1 BBBD Race 1]|uniref:F-box domain-containing protein n=1 Tax=Puccinia triticina (isolate 1-1 / race 1 (BBBD)) TaxID=630390 RepID=A0A0C4F239_PUCT1|nr:hypothetical protein PTTG_07160 [Puccinia triticina 1-1 BBBD Race 1]
MDRLPSELWELILRQIPNSLLRQTCLSLRTLTPHIPLSHQYRHLAIASDAELSRLRTDTAPPNAHLAALIHSVSLSAWRLRDNNLLINLINSAPNTRLIFLHIGPLFAPEQLDDLLRKHKPSLELLLLRFNQNVSIRSYEPFLKGAYFDTCLELLAKWPETPCFQSLSFVQDPPPQPVEKQIQHEGIAQPIILFRFWAITALAVSPLGRHLRRLRLRIPGRNLAGALTSTSTRVERVDVGPALHVDLPVPPFPSLEFLDISTSALPSVVTGLGPILRRFPCLTHLVIDRAGLIVPARFPADMDRVDETLRAIGSSVATAGLPRALEAKKLWSEAHAVFLQALALRHVSDTSASIAEDRPPHQPTAGPSTTTTAKTRRGRSAYASAPRWKPATLAPSSSTPSTTILPSSCPSSQKTRLEDERIPEKVSFLPDYSRLLSLCCGTALSPAAPEGEAGEDGEEEEEKTREAWESTFRGGFRTGLAKVDAAVQEAVEGHRRAVKVWKVGLDRLRKPQLVGGGGSKTKGTADGADPDNDKQAEERAAEVARKLNNRPVILVLSPSPPPFTGPTGPEEGLFGRFKRALNLVELPSSGEEEEEEEGALERAIAGYRNSRRRSDDGPAFCVRNGCAKHGVVGWMPPEHERPVRLIQSRRPPPLTPEHPPDEHQLVAGLQALALSPPRENDTLLADLGGELRHPVGCAHLVARTMWDVDSW